MAFHVACPITCERICYCDFGFSGRPRGEKRRREFAEEAARVEEFLRDPWWVRAGDGTGTAQVLVPKILSPVAAAAALVEDGGRAEGEYLVTAQAKRAALQREAAAASVAAEDYVRRLEAMAGADGAGDLDRDLAGEDQMSSTAKVICRLCFSGENEGSDKAMKMLPCKTCNKKYHRSCLKNWAENRDLFHWSSWACPSCRICEVCRRSGDPSKFMFCKRCDAAYHCYCQHPPHKNVGRGPYLCPKHTRCHSCASSVPGSGPSTRWFLSYTCCDACGRLFVKGNYCPVCLKVYRDSESTPMVCCDDCQRWVHCLCDGISDEKYQQFQADGNLYYRCAACRGDCYQAKDIDDAVQELWRRRDKSDRDLISSLKAAAGLPYQDDILSVSPFSDDEENDPMVNHGRSLKLSVKSVTDKVIKGGKEYGKKSSKNSSSSKKRAKKKDHQLQLVDKSEESSQKFLSEKLRPPESGYIDEKNREVTPSETRESDDQIPVRGKLSVYPIENENHSSKKETVETSSDYVAKVDIKHRKTAELHSKECSKKLESKKETIKGPKLVIHLGPRKSVTCSPKSETSSCHREHDLGASNGNEASSQRPVSDIEKHMLERKDGTSRTIDGKGTKFVNKNEVKFQRQLDKRIKKLGKNSSLDANISRGIISQECQPTAGGSLELWRLKTEESDAMETADEATEGDEIILMANSKTGSCNTRGEFHSPTHLPSVSNSSRDLKPLLKLKFKNLHLENQSPWVSHGEDKSSVKGQRSKRKRPSPLRYKVCSSGDAAYRDFNQESMTDEVLDANWILQKLGKDAVGKRIEIQRQSDSSWHRGVVSDVIDGATFLSVRMDSGGTKTLEFGKQAIRFISQKRRTKL